MGELPSRCMLELPVISIIGWNQSRSLKTWSQCVGAAHRALHFSFARAGHNAQSSDCRLFFISGLTSQAAVLEHQSLWIAAPAGSATWPRERLELPERTGVPRMRLRQTHQTLSLPPGSRMSLGTRR